MKVDNQPFGSGRSEGRTNIVEGFAISASLLCLVHCLVLPAILIFLPAAFAMTLESELVHVGVLLFILPAALFAFWSGYKHHRTVPPLLIGLTGLLCLVVAVLPPESELRELWMTIAGSVLLVFAHLWNWRLRCPADH